MKNMKRFILFVLAGGLAASLSAQINLPEYQFVEGNWVIQGDRVYQNDEKSGFAKANLKFPQKGAMIYEFNVRYEKGLEDGQGGFGIHLFEDRPLNAKSWGAGKSWLLWLNYDKNPIKNSGIPAGLSGQIYRSINNSSMELVHSADLNKYLSLLTKESLNKSIFFKIYANGETGEIRIYDPSDAEGLDYLTYTIDKKYLPLKGEWVSVRTNGVSLSFTLPPQK